MSEELVNQLLGQARSMVEKALAQFRFAPGNPATSVVSGYPYSVVGSLPGPAAGVVTEVDKWFGYWERTGDKVQFFPDDHTVTVEGRRCYDDPLPLLTLPYRKVFVFVETKKRVSATLYCHVEGPSATPTSYPESCEVLSTDIRLFDEIPTEVPAPVENSCGGPSIQVGYPYIPANLYWPGDHTFYTPLFVKDEGDPTDENITPLRDLSYTGVYKIDETGVPRTEFNYWAARSTGSSNFWLSGFLEAGDFFSSVYASSTIQPAFGRVVDAPLGP